MAIITVDLNERSRKMKPMHAGGQPPLLGNGKDTYMHYLTEAGIPYSRLHDVGGMFGGGRFVDIPNIFRDFDADENDPASYDFTFTDHLLAQLVNAGVEPYFRLGVTIENGYLIKAYRIFPPADPEKWARICEHIVRHYNEGWADGFHYGITYWEIWNEADNPPMWQGTPEEYYHLFDVTAKHLKACFPNIKVGGYAMTCLCAIAGGRWGKPAEEFQSFIDYFHGFMGYLKEHETPIDFFSWHSYENTEKNAIMDAWVHEQLTSYGLSHVESHLNEWNPYASELGTAHHSAEVAATMIALQHGYTDVCCIYDMRTNTAPFSALFNPITHRPIHAYYAMVAFNTLYQLGHEAAATSNMAKLHVLAASDGERHAMLISNLTGGAQRLEFQGVDLSKARYHVIDGDRLLSWAPNANVIGHNAVILIEW